ncbi:hypothetical protein [Maribacter sp. 2210JD10-5]|uniref:hypothetical protein n=1 Tax=Maribacter sp. 2210JD10-5 TaxID=3386272 RepID=UPI0039BD71A4
MSVLESLNDTSNKAVEVGEQYYKKTQEYYKLKIFQQLALTTGMFSKMAIIGSLLFLGFLLFMIAGTIYLGNLLGSIILSCIIMGFALLVIAFILFKIRKKIDNAIVKKLSAKFFD